MTALFTHQSYIDLTFTPEMIPTDDDETGAAPNRRHGYGRQQHALVSGWEQRRAFVGALYARRDEASLPTLAQINEAAAQFRRAARGAAARRGAIRLVFKDGTRPKSVTGGSR
jgi:hypothetical protein